MEFNVLMNREELDAYLRWVDETATPDVRERHSEEASEAFNAAQSIAKVGIPNEEQVISVEPEPAFDGDNDTFIPEQFDTPESVVLSSGLEETKTLLAQLANACGDKNASFRLIEHYAGKGSGLSKVDPSKYGAICQSARYLINNKKAALRWAKGEDTTKRVQS